MQDSSKQLSHPPAGSVAPNVIKRQCTALKWHCVQTPLKFLGESGHIKPPALGSVREDVVVSGRRRKFTTEFKVEAAHRVIDSGPVRPPDVS